MTFDSRKIDTFSFLAFSTIVFSRPESLNSIFIKQILTYCIFRTYPGTLLTLFLIFLIIFSKGLSLLLIFSENELFFPIDHFYCFHFVIILFHWCLFLSFLILLLLFSLDIVLLLGFIDWRLFLFCLFSLDLRCKKELIIVFGSWHIISSHLFVWLLI